MDANVEFIIENGHVIDPLSGLNEQADIAIAGKKIVAMEKRSNGGLKSLQALKRIDASDKLVCPGLIDLHVHVYEYITNFGVWADDAGVGVGATTIVDAGSTGPWTFGGFKAHVIDKAKTDVRAFMSINAAGALMGGMKGDILHNPSVVDLEASFKLMKQYPESIRGIKCHGESGSFSRWGLEVLTMASDLGRKANLPLYVHTGELFPVIEDSRLEPRTLLSHVLPLLKQGDTLAHIYSNMPDGIIGDDESIPEVVYAALDRGIHFDIGYGINFSYRIARLLINAGIFPNTISSDIHGDFNSYHDLSKLDYSLPGAMSRLLHLGMPLLEVIRAVTVNPAKVIGESDHLGLLSVGSHANISILEKKKGPWTLLDGRNEALDVDIRLIPWLTFRDGVSYLPNLAMLPDLLINQSERIAEEA